MSSARSVSVVIPVYNDATGIRNCLSALERQSLPRQDFEVIVVDDGSTDDSIAAARSFPWVRVFAQKNAGSYAARNLAIENANSRLFAFTDSDCTPMDTWLEEGLRCLASSERIGLVAGDIQVFAANPKRPSPAESFEICFAFPQADYVRHSSFGATANVFTRRAVFDDVGVFNGSLESGGDAEWGERVGRGGWEVVYCPACITRHPARATWAELATKTHRVFRGFQALKLTMSPWAWLRALLYPVPASWRVLMSRQLDMRSKWGAIAILVRITLLRQWLRLPLVRRWLAQLIK